MINNDDMPEKVANELANWKVEFPTSKEKSWEQLSAKINHKETPVVSLPNRRRWLKIAAAASICLILGLTFVMNNSENTEFVTSNGETQEIILPDNSIVILNAGSMLSYNLKEWESERKVELTGEAYFEVERGSDFSVYTNHGRVSVLGTKFNVYDRENSYKVGCSHGKVSVKTTANEIILTEGQFSELKANGLTTPRNKEYISSWVDGVVHFEEENLSEVFQEIERQFNVTIDHQGDGNREYTGSFEMGSLEQTLTLICEPMNLNFDIGKESIITIK